jgi:hypothetical protein
MKDALAVGDELDLGEVLFESRFLSEDLVCPADFLKRHPAVHQIPDDTKRNKVPERVKPANSRAASGGLDTRPHQSDLVPIT